MQNPLLDLSTQPLPRFSDIRPEHAEPALDYLLADNRARIAELLLQNIPCSWNTFIEPLEALEERLNQMWSIVSHLHAVMNTPAWRDVYHACLPKLSEYSTEMGQHTGIYHAYKSIAESPEYETLNTAQKKTIEHQLRDFRLSGVHLESAQKQRYGEIHKELTSLSAHFENNVMDATMAWNKLITEPKQLSGLPEHTINAARATAEKHEHAAGWLLTLDYPCYDAVMTYADDRALREEMYHAYVTRASDQGPFAGRWDNTPLLESIIKLRQELAELLDFPTYAELSLATKMAKHPQEVIEFLMDLAKRSRSYAQSDWDTLSSFAKEQGFNETLCAWDVAYYSEKLMHAHYEIMEEKIRPYFPIDKALAGLFQVVERIYKIQIEERTNINTWHPDVRFFEIYDAQKTLRGQFYLDPYARPHKRDGAWMDDCRQRWRMPNNAIQIPIAYLVCNFRSPSKDTPALLSHDEVITLFHEFGHGLQHLLTRMDCLSVAGIQGVAWDAVELPSQFMENWCWQEEALKFISSHYLTGEPLPQAWLKNMLAAKNFHSGLHINRQLLFALFDMRLHSEYAIGKIASVQALLDELRATLFVVPTPSYNHFQNSFTHIFSGGYAAGYYSYLWAEVLSCDAFSKFEEHGIFDAKTGHEFLSTILEQGGSQEPMDLFIQFRGRSPNIQAFLRHSGLLNE